MRAHPAGPRHADLLPEAGPGLPPADLHALAEHVWPGGLSRDATGVLRLHGHAVPDLAAAHGGTPAFLLDEADFRARARGYATAFAGDAPAHPTADVPRPRVYYAAKAFLSRAIARWVAEEGLGLDVCTGGELAVALAAGFPPDRIALHGNNKDRTELVTAVEAGVGLVVLDAAEEITLLDQVAAVAGRVQPVLVRVTVGVEAHTHEYIATAHEDVKFGFSMASGAAAAAVRAVLAAPHLELRGLHSHIGSQIFDTAGFEVAAHRLATLLVAIRDEHGVQLPELDLGGGLGIAYVAADDPEPVEHVASRLREIVRRECATAGLDVPAILVEPGRAIVGPAAVTVYTVGTVKDVDGIRTYVSVDGGMSDNIRTALYDADYTVVLANRVSAVPPTLCRVVGKHCESGDVVVRDAWLPGDVAPGDLLVVAATGAYCRSMASNYNHLPRPAVVAVSSSAVTPVLRRETLADLLATDVG
jgi:diaminopimelate decarboxylase